MFFLFPVGHEKRQLRRPPWVSRTLLALNVVVALATIPFYHPEDIARAFSRVFSFLQEHTYLELPPDFQERLPRTIADDLARLRAGGPRPPRSSLLSEQQAHLEELCRQASDAVAGSVFIRWGHVPERPAAVTLFTSQFLHGGWLHLAGNMLFLMLAAPLLEDVWGRGPFLAFYLLGGAAAAWLHATILSTSSSPLIGASGAIAALMGAWLVRFHGVRIQFVYFFFNPFTLLTLRRFGRRGMRGMFWAPAQVMLPLWIGTQLVQAFWVGASSGVAFWAHVGGFGFGLIVARILQRTGIEERLLAPALDADLGSPRHSALRNGIEARLRGDRRARALLERARALDPQHPQVYIELYRVAEASNDDAAAAGFAARYAALELLAGRPENVRQTYRDVTQRLGRADWEPSTLLGLGRHLEATGDDEEAGLLYEDLAERHVGTPPAARALARLGALRDRQGRDEEAVSAYLAARQAPGLDRALRREVEERLVEMVEELPPLIVPPPPAAGARVSPVSPGRASAGGGEPARSQPVVTPSPLSEEPETP